MQLLKEILRRVVSCFADNPHNDAREDDDLPPIRPTIYKNTQVRFDCSFKEVELDGCPLNICETLDDIDNDCIRIADRVTSNALRLKEILEELLLEEDNDSDAPPFVGPKPFYEEKHYYELE